MSKLLLDTDVLIDVLRGRDTARARLVDLISRFVPCCSVITVAEIYAGMRQEEEDATRMLLDGLIMIPVTGETAELAGRLRYKAKSRRLELADCLIAATALIESATLATGNVKDYPFADLSLIDMRT